MVFQFMLEVRTKMLYAIDKNGLYSGLFWKRVGQVWGDIVEKVPTVTEPQKLVGMEVKDWPNYG